MGLVVQVSQRESPTRARLVAAEQVRSQYQNMPTACISNAVASVILCFTLRDTVSTPILLGWLAAAYSWVLGRFLQWRAFNRAQPAPADIERWLLYGIAGSAYNGLVWGIGGI